MTSEEFDELENKLEGWERDALRYRWLRTAGAWESEIGLDILSNEPDSFDAAVDAAMSQGPNVI